MIVGATVFAGLLLLLLLAERAGSLVWRDGADDGPRYYCPPCDLRYPAAELRDREAGTCPRGHRVQAPAQGFTMSTFLVFVCVAFIALGAVLIATGRTSGP